MEPIQDLDGLELREAVERLNPRLEHFEQHTGPSVRPCLGVSMREVHGVWMRPMNTNPASVAGGISTAISALRIAFSRTILTRLNYYREGDGAVHWGVLWARRASCAYRLCHPNVVPMETAEPSD